MASLRGRVLESDGVSLVLASGGRRVALRAGGLDARPGDLVRMEAEGDRALRVEVLFRPRVPLADALRWQGERADLLRRRHLATRALRERLHADGFCEIPSPLLVRGACPDAHIDSFFADGRALVSSTEYQLKRLLVGGVERLYSLTQNFRAGDLGERHNPEFTMLEWARAWEDLDAIERDAEALVRDAVSAASPGASSVRWQGRSCLLDAPWERLSVQQALADRLGIAVADDFPLAGLLDGARAAGVEVPAGLADDRAYVMSFLLDLLTPLLGHPTPTFLRDWPAFMTSSAELVPGKPHLAVRSELFIAGLEVADGFPFLRDHALQRALFDREQERRLAQGKPPAPVDEQYLHALAEGIPPGAGMALGVDRLVMLATGAPSLEQVMPFGWGEL